MTDNQILLGMKNADKGMSTIGSASKTNVWNAGRSWVRDGAKEILDNSGNLIGYSSKDGMRAFSIIGFTPADTVKDVIDFIKGEDTITSDKINRWLLGAMIITPEAIDIAIKKGAKNGDEIVDAIKNVNNQGEQVINGMQSYEQARNLALDLVDLGSDSKPYYGRLGSSVGNGQIVGRQSANGKIRWRLDYDPKKGTHINVEDFSVGKGIDAKKYVITFEGDEETYKSLLKHLNR